MYVNVNSKKDKGKALKDHILKDIAPRRPDARIKEIQEKYQQAIEEKDATIALLNDDLKDRKYENVGLQGEVRQRINRQLSCKDVMQAIFQMKIKTIKAKENTIQNTKKKKMMK